MVFKSILQYLVCVEFVSLNTTHLHLLPHDDKYDDTKDNSFFIKITLKKVALGVCVTLYFRYNVRMRSEKFLTPYSITSLICSLLIKRVSRFVI